VVKNAPDALTSYVTNVRNVPIASEMSYTALSATFASNVQTGSASAVKDARSAHLAAKIATKNAQNAHRKSFALPA
jgi:hypothetical protein